jgi:(4-(4-[2-(gamma-L-glutamylamino)ethyl]phenoxymethyl)furan-2-yl)methanamine synthase
MSDTYDNKLARTYSGAAMENSTSVIGWDLGGANLKLAHIETRRALEVALIPCPLRHDASKFDAALAEALPLCPRGAVHAVTMTGELSDVFSDRARGVAYLVEMMRNSTDGEAIFYGGRAGFLHDMGAVAHALDVASSNWHASATLVAQFFPDALLIDAGTTTTDLIPLKGGAVAARGYSDAERLAENELVYTGVVRTPVMAVARTAPFKGRMQGVAAERFATMADVWRLLGALPAGADPYPAPDLKGKSTQESAARLGRMLGRDATAADLLAYVDLARYFADCQLAEIEAAALTLASREGLTPDAPVIGAGSGRFIARHVAARLGRRYHDFADLIDCAPQARDMAAACAPAVAVGLLAAHELIVDG